MTKQRKSPMFAMLGLALFVAVWVARGVVERKTPSIFEAGFAAIAVRMFYERSDEAMDIAIRFLDKDAD
ncbi:MAG: hypothetical protein AAFY26_20725 [Cyanobacteria bacterium J06638_22]